MEENIEYGFEKTYEVKKKKSKKGLIIFGSIVGIVILFVCFVGVKYASLIKQNNDYAETHSVITKEEANVLKERISIREKTDIGKAEKIEFANKVVYFINYETSGVDSITTVYSSVANVSESNVTEYDKLTEDVVFFKFDLYSASQNLLPPFDVKDVPYTPNFQAIYVVDGKTFMGLLEYDTQTKKVKYSVNLIWASDNSALTKTEYEKIYNLFEENIPRLFYLINRYFEKLNLPIAELEYKGLQIYV